MFITKTEWLIAKRYLKTKRKESFITIISWLSLIGITLGVAVLIIVMSVMNGFKKDLINSIVGIEGHINLTSMQGRFINNYKIDTKYITANPKIASVGYSIDTQALISTKYYNSGVMVKGLSLADLLHRKATINVSQKYANKFANGEKVALIGKKLAQSMGINEGDSIKLVFPEFTPTLGGTVPKHVTMVAAGTFSTGMFQYDNNMIVIPLHIAQLIFATKGVQTIEVFTTNPEQTQSIKQVLINNIPPNLYITTWKENNLSLIGALDTERNVMFIILFLIITVATFNIMSGLIMLVKSKTKEIAILKTLGFTSKNIQTVFLIIGLRTGIIGTFIGVILGVLFSLNIEHIRDFAQYVLNVKLFSEDVYFLAKLPSDVSFVEVSVIAGFSILLSIIASIYPARKAAKTIIARALYYE